MNTILVIDDNEAFRADLLELLNFEGYQGLEAENGEVGLYMIPTYAPHLILCDINMPVMDGLELLKIVKADPVLTKIPFLLLTGHTAKLTQVKARDLGVQAYLIKPLMIAKLLSSIASFIVPNSE